jgi:transposase-like protein
MRYLKLTTPEFFEKICSEEAARALLWRSKFDGKDFVCPRCTHEDFYQHNSRPEIRQCRLCDKQVRLRAGTVFEHTKVSLLLIVRAVFLMTQDKRGVSALQLVRQLRMRSYDTAWRLLHRIREALRQRDTRYTLRGIVELDAADFGEQKDRGRKEVLIAVETKEWVDERGRPKKRAGFAKVVLGRESKIHAQNFVDNNLQPGTQVNTDGSNAFADLRGVDTDHRVMGALPGQLDAWLPWVQKWSENAKAWLAGTFHGVRREYFGRYLAEYTYRFNRRHDPGALFHRALTACALATPIRADALFG